MNDDGKEKVYSIDMPRQAVNAGVVVVRPGAEDRRLVEALLSSNARSIPGSSARWTRTTSLGYAGIPVNLNGSCPTSS